jgi:hypothetical protein
LSAHVEDLFSEDVALAFKSNADLDKSHFGFPNRDADLPGWAAEQLPSIDDHRVFGFNLAI